MKVLLSLLLAAVTCLDLGHSLQCYTCRDLTPVEKCLTIENCTGSDFICKTTMYSEEDVYPPTGISVVTKMCSSSCVPSDLDGIGMTHPVTCCYSDLCNFDGAASLRISVVPVGILASSLCAFFWTRL
ncbi:ly6/PLAUR domain-containing protein 2-like [Cyanistes caeruleus]|uniref:Ly6/PLAUR domain-containing protein 2-like n=1 Tax=Cyanistes caeruleus TaxID=156563 RepID=A0A8C0UW73_CYACU|nr:ly6/PLAUR domain-containing protein 2-like [Cyanistes caeruleus]